MSAVTIRESYDGGSIVVDTTPARFAGAAAKGRVRVNAYERGMESATLHLSLGEVDALIGALQAARSEAGTPGEVACIGSGKSRWSELLLSGGL